MGLKRPVDLGLCLIWRSFNAKQVSSFDSLCMELAFFTFAPKRFTMP